MPELTVYGYVPHEAIPYPVVGGMMYRYKFPNGYGASVIPLHSFLEEGNVREVAVLDEEGRITSTPLIELDDVERMPSHEVKDMLRRISELPPRLKTLDASARLALEPGTEKEQR